MYYEGGRLHGVGHPRAEAGEVDPDGLAGLADVAGHLCNSIV